MKHFSIWSIVFIVLGLLAFGLSSIAEAFTEPIVLIGFIFLLLGAIFSFIAISKKEKGITKKISLISFFIVLFLVTWFEPFQVVYIMTWLKNIL